MANGTPDSSLLKYKATWSCKKSQSSWINSILPPELMCFAITSLISNISLCFIVRSSSVVPAFTSDTTDGRMQTGDTNKRVTSRSAGFALIAVIPSSGMSDCGTLRNRSKTCSGFSSWMSAGGPMSCSNSRLHSVAARSSSGKLEL